MVELTKTTVGSRASGDLSQEANHAMPKSPPPVHRTIDELNLPHIVRDTSDYDCVVLCAD